MQQETNKKLKSLKKKKKILISGNYLKFNRVLWEVLLGHEGRMLAAPLEQRGEPGLVL